jgi:DNA-directed RNA polymerase subunit E'/Rpb7
LDPSCGTRVVRHSVSVTDIADTSFVLKNTKCYCKNKTSTKVKVVGKRMKTSTREEKEIAIAMAHALGTKFGMPTIHNTLQQNYVNMNIFIRRL